MQTKTQALMRAGISLVELLVVIAIIAVLAALSVGIIRAVLDSQQKANTEAAMRTVHKVLLRHWNEVAGAARTETPSAAVLALAGNDARRAQVIWIKMRLVEAFPQSYADVLSSGSPATPPAWHNYIPAGSRKYANFQRALTTANAGGSPAVQSSACLLLALSVRRGGAALKAEDLGPAARDIDNDGLKEIVDGWGRPIEFTRFPVGDAILQSKSPVKTGYCDPVDSEGMLLTNSWANPSPAPTPPTLSSRQIFEGVCHVVSFNNAEPRTPPANYIVPILKSQGSDVSNSKDDIYSYSLD